MPTNPKQIPELTAITAPTAGQETDIETVVAKQSTYATYKMTLAQIFTFATVSGAIKTALDNLSTLISGNTTSINNLSTNKLDKSGALRTSLTAKRVLIVDSSGNETYLSGTSPQQIGFDGSGNPATITPTVDIQGLTTKNTPITADRIPIYDSESGLPNKNFSPNSINLGQYGNGSDGNITVSGTVTMTSDKQYKDVTLSDGCILKTNGFKLYISGTLTRSGTGTGYIDVSGTSGGNGGDGVNRFSGGAAGGVAGTIPYTTGTLPIPVVPGVGGNNTVSGAGGAGTAQTKCLVKQNGAAGGAAGTSYYTVGPNTYTSASAGSGGSFTATDNPLITLFDLNLLLSLSPPSGIVWSTIGASAGAGASTTSSYTASGGGGGAGANGGVLWVAVRNIVSVGASAIFRSKGGNGGNGGNGYTDNSQQFGGGGGGGGGGNGGVVVVIYATSNVTVSTIVDVTGGTGGIGGTKAPGNPFNTNGSNGGNGANGLLVTYTI